MIGIVSPDFLMDRPTTNLRLIIPDRGGQKKIGNNNDWLLGATLKTAPALASASARQGLELIEIIPSFGPNINFFAGRA